MADYNERHRQYLANLVHHLSYIQIPRVDVGSIIVEPEWFNQATGKQKSLCDLLIGHFDDTMSAVELKGSIAKRGKALDQLHYGKEFIETRMHRSFRQGIFVVYKHPKEYYFERYDSNFNKL